jgi:hypothetical protein
MKRRCSVCGEPLSESNPGKRCDPCQMKKFNEEIASFEQKITSGKDWIGVRGYADILGLESEEQLRRLARDGKLAPRIPAISQWRWRPKDIEDWFKQKQRAGDIFRKTAMGIAGNLRRCSNDSVIYCLSDTIGSTVYGEEPVMGTTASGRVEPVTLVKVDKSAALNLLKQLPGKDFPELSGITDWGDLAYDMISEALIVRLEAYF